MAVVLVMTGRMLLLMGIRVALLVMMPGGGESRAGKDHQQQGGGKNLLHGMNLARE